MNGFETIWCFYNFYECVLKAVAEAKSLMTSIFRKTKNDFDNGYIDVKCPCYKFQNMCSIYLFVANFSGCWLKLFS